MPESHSPAHRLVRPQERIITSVACRIRRVVSAGAGHDVRSVVGGGSGVGGSAGGKGTSIITEDAQAVVLQSKAGLGAAIVILSIKPPSYSILYTIPIDAQMRIHLAQSPPSPSTSHFQQSARPPISLRLTCPSRDPVDLLIAAKLSEETQRFVREIRRLVEDAETFTSTLYPGWIGFYPDMNSREVSYTSKDKGAIATAAAATAMPSGELREKQSAAVSGEKVEDGEIDVRSAGTNEPSSAGKEEKEGDGKEEIVDLTEDLKETSISSSSRTPASPKQTSHLPSTSDTRSSHLNLGILTSTETGTERETETELDDPERHPNPFAPGFSRTTFLRKRVFEVEDEWSSSRPIRVRIGTFNVNDKLPPPDTVELEGFVGDGEEEVLVMGFQEVDLRSQALLYSQGNSRAEEWERALIRGLKEKGEQYEKVAMSQYVGVLLIVLVRRDVKDAVGEVQMSEKGIGLLGFGGNKAGVAVRIRIHDSVFCFVNSHLAAFATALERRRTDYATLRSSLAFPSAPTLAIPGAASADADVFDEFQAEGKIKGVEECHYLFWMGDLNYRIDMPDDILSAWVEDEKWSQILEKDQLRQDMYTGKSFAGFSEAEIAFPPTYKYIHGTPDRDPKRAPAFTDRILSRCPPSKQFRSRYRAGSRTGSVQGTPSASTPIPLPSPGSSPAKPSPTSSKQLSSSPSDSTATPTRPSPHRAYSTSPSLPGLLQQEQTNRLNDRIECESYASYPDVQWSDHQPVSATFKMDLRVVDEGQRTECLLKAKNELERLGEVWRPAVKVEGGDVDFGAVKYRCTYIRYVNVSNTGRVPASVGFKSLGPDKAICKSMYWVHPGEVTLQPGDSLRLAVMLKVNEEWASRFTAGEDMNDVLVLQVKEGNDTFITLSATFEPTVVGVPLHALASHASPIRSSTLDERRKTFGVMLKDQTIDPYAKEKEGEHAKPVKEVWRALEYLMQSEDTEAKLWIPLGDAGEDERVLDIIEALDTAADLPESSASASSAVSLALLHLLQSLPDPLIPRSKAQECVDAGDRDAAYGSLEGMSGVNTNVLIGLMSVVKLGAAPTRKAGDAQSQEEGEIRAIPHAIVKVLADSIFGSAIVDPSSLPGSYASASAVEEGRLRFVRLLLEG